MLTNKDKGSILLSYVEKSTSSLKIDAHMVPYDRVTICKYFKGYLYH